MRGAQLAVKELNAAGGVTGYTFEVVVGDTKDQTPAAVTSAVGRLLGDSSINFMATGYASGTNFEINLVQKANMPSVWVLLAPRRWASSAKRQTSTPPSGR